MQLVILGMHRSGTSFLSRLLQLMGAWIGRPDELDPPGWGNPRGLWELTELRILHEQALARLGCTWAGVEPLARSGAPLAADPELLAGVGRVIARLDEHRPWAVKDPRACLFLGAWRHLLTAPVVLLMHRAPVAVARSLARRDGFPPLASLALWEFYNLRALQASRGLPCIKIAFEEVMADPYAFSERLRVQLGSLGVTGLGTADHAALDAFFDIEAVSAAFDPSPAPAPLSEGAERILEALRGPGIPDEVSGLRLDEATIQTLGLLHRVVALEEALQHADSRSAHLETWGAQLTREVERVRAGQGEEIVHLQGLVRDLTRELLVFRGGRRGRILGWLERLLGRSARASLTGLVDPEYYFEKYPDVAGSGLDPLRHWLEFGCFENRRPRRT